MCNPIKQIYFWPLVLFAYPVKTPPASLLRNIFVPSEMLLCLFDQVALVIRTLKYSCTIYYLELYATGGRRFLVHPLRVNQRGGTGFIDCRLPFCHFRRVPGILERLATPYIPVAIRGSICQQLWIAPFLDRRQDLIFKQVVFVRRKENGFAFFHVFMGLRVFFRKRKQEL